YPHQVYGPFLGEHLVGMGILSRYPIVDIENFKLATDGLIFQQRASIMIEDKTITMYNIHLTPPRIHMKRNAFFSHVPWLIYDYYIRREEVKNFVALIKGQQAPIVAAGDFNFSNHSREYRLLAAFLNDAYDLV